MGGRGRTAALLTESADAAGMDFDALTRAKAEGADVLLVDAAGRLHNKSVLLVLDATTGQNAVQ